MTQPEQDTFEQRITEATKTRNFKAFEKHLTDAFQQVNNSADIALIYNSITNARRPQFLTRVPHDKKTYNYITNCYKAFESHIETFQKASDKRSNVENKLIQMELECAQSVLFNHSISPLEEEIQSLININLIAEYHSKVLNFTVIDPKDPRLFDKLRKTAKKLEHDHKDFRCAEHLRNYAFSVISTSNPTSELNSIFSNKANGVFTSLKKIGNTFLQKVLGGHKPTGLD